MLLCLGQGLYLAIGWENPAERVSRISGPAGARSTIRLVVSLPNGADPDDGHDAADVAGRTNHRARHRQRRVAGHHHRHSGAAAAGGQRRCRTCFSPAAGSRPISTSGTRIVLVLLLAGGDCRRHRRHAGAAENSGAIRPARGRAQNVFRRHVVHAVARELLRRHADHFRPVHPDVPAADFPVHWPNHVKVPFFRIFFHGLALQLDYGSVLLYG